MGLSGHACSLWRELVLVASLLACGIHQASGQISIVPLIGTEGHQSFLDLAGAPKDALEYSWHQSVNDGAENVIVGYKPSSGSWQPGPKFSGQETVTRTGNLVIRNSVLNGTGNYPVRVDASSGTQRAAGWLEIRELESNPGISVNSSSTVEYMDSVAAFCHTAAANVEWYVNALLVTSNDQMTISPDGKMLVIHRVGRDDRVLQCAIKNIFGLLQRSGQISLTVAYGPDSVLLRTDPHHIRGIVSAETGTRVRMECVSTSFPGPKYRWVHNDSLLSFSEANITLPSLAWEQMGRYRCVVENPVAQLSMYRDVEVQRPWHVPVLRRGFYTAGPLAVFFAVATVLGGVYLCGILVYVPDKPGCVNVHLRPGGQDHTGKEGSKT